ncbi:MAG: iron ABC transporter permease [Lachnospiraceae bacterium]|nr:iron ABC transporter permease [Lachnospiraceae bacterium]
MRRKNVLLGAVLGVLPLVLGLFAICFGRYSIGIREVLACLAPPLFPDVAVSDYMKTVVYNIRLPRVALALISGAGLSAAGAGFQGIFSNPMATPDTLGVASGASFGAAFAILLGWDIMAIQGMAIVFGGVAVLIAMSFVLKPVEGQSPVVMLILAGMVVGALFSAMLSMVKYGADPQDVLPAITYWLMGSLTGTTFIRLAAGAPLILVGGVIIFVLRWRLNAMSLSDDEAKSLGVNVKRVRTLVIVACTMITASVIAMCGQIGWVGLLIPHVSRMIFGNDNRLVVPASFGLGSVFLLVTDTVARSASAAEIPVSILTALIGAPFFIFLLRRTGGVKS